VGSHICKSHPPWNQSFAANQEEGFLGNTDVGPELPFNSQFQIAVSGAQLALVR
jgi:hypothetical protein